MIWLVFLHFLIFAWVLSWELEYYWSARKKLGVAIYSFFWEFWLLWFLITGLYKFTLDLIYDR